MSEQSEQIVNLGERSYPLLIGGGLLQKNGILDPFIADADVFIVTNEVVGPLYLQSLTSLLGARRIDSIELPDGEVFKTIATFESIIDRLVAGRYARDAVLMTLGGGVVGDIGGFAAAAYQRGIRFIQMPTTLLAQVDSAVGGKTAVNHAGGKNLIGAFHQPSAVLIDTDTLVTLPDRELRAGLAEIVKYGLIVDAEFFAWLEAHAADLLAREPAALHHAIRRSCQLKAAIVAEDERETGRRALLNLGHTYGHAIERCAGYGEWLHGEAIAAGICMAAEFSVRLGYLESADVARISALLAALELPTAPPSDISVADFMAAMSIDKKVIGGEIRLVLMHAIGTAEVTADYPSADLGALLAEQLGR
ncbi:MAG: 3-dehydroquinate synthase [Gammaproteobacteria bacterium]|jgi:3-dehydroquinate synthase|nr:3-dehydroquinate synthase [Chromatiales bacterium]MDP6437408.1 3-dehydroquinate synthase [Gammaproteobacteria bacterium]MDP6673355.1 3-dehydroquinate synthase [Gammaproteobacteria bacterium]